MAIYAVLSFGDRHKRNPHQGRFGAVSAIQGASVLHADENRDDLQKASSAPIEKRKGDLIADTAALVMVARGRSRRACTSLTALRACAPAEAISVDMFLTDPPLRHDPELLGCAAAAPGAVEAVKWAVKPEGAVLFFAQCPWRQGVGASNLAMLRYEWVWYKKPLHGFFNVAASAEKTENILVFYQKSPRAYFRSV